MDFNKDLTLVRDVKATLIPAGDDVQLPEGTRAVISQALGGSVTIRTDSGLFRLSREDWDALGEATAAGLEEEYEAGSPSVTEGASLGEEHIWEALRSCFDPEIPVNIVDLGLIYDLRMGEADEAGRCPVDVKMTLTAQGCGMGPVIADDAKSRIEALAGVSEAQVEIVWDPPWTPHMISEEGRKKLGLE
ncbi:MAG: iron-sulfur cluster assembly protein [Opitutales bacterium]